jgi:hypothetical protein
MSSPEQTLASTSRASPESVGTSLTPCPVSHPTTTTTSLCTGTLSRNRNLTQFSSWKRSGARTPPPPRISPNFGDQPLPNLHASWKSSAPPYHSTTWKAAGVGNPKDAGTEWRASKKSLPQPHGCQGHREATPRTSKSAKCSSHLTSTMTRPRMRACSLSKPRSSGAEGPYRPSTGDTAVRWDRAGEWHHRQPRDAAETDTNRCSCGMYNTNAHYTQQRTYCKHLQSPLLEIAAWRAFAASAKLSWQGSHTCLRAWRWSVVTPQRCVHVFMGTACSLSASALHAVPGPICARCCSVGGGLGLPQRPSLMIMPGVF